MTFLLVRPGFRRNFRFWTAPIKEIGLQICSFRVFECKFSSVSSQLLNFWTIQIVSPRKSSTNIELRFEAGELVQGRHFVQFFLSPTQETAQAETIETNFELIIRERSMSVDLRSKHGVKSGLLHQELFQEAEAAKHNEVCGKQWNISAAKVDQFASVQCGRN